MKQITFTVYCKAEPQGSKRAFVVPGKNGMKVRAAVVDSNSKKMRSYRYDMHYEAIIAMHEAGVVYPLAGKQVPVEMHLEFMFVRPSSQKKRLWPTVKPDIDKLERATLDALHGVLFVDDSQVVVVHKSKVYGTMEQVKVSARIVEEACLF